MKLVIGLGNPEKKYEKTRHNIGRRVVTHLALHLDAGVPVLQEKFRANIAEAMIKGEKVLLAAPETFMNESGEAVRSLVSFYKIALRDFLLIHDEMDYAFGTIRFSAGGGPAGHQGVKSVIESLGTEVFARLRIGIGRPAAPKAKEAYVLEKFDNKESLRLDLLVEKSGEAVYDWVTLGLDKSMNLWNGIESD